MHPKIGQQFGMQFIRHHEVVADRTVICDRLSCLTGVASIVAPEAPCRVGVANIVRMASPSDVHGRKDITSVDLIESIGRSFYLCSLGVPDRRIL